MDNIHSSYLKSVQNDPIDECQKLLKTLSSMVASCPVCTNKLLKMVGVPPQAPHQQTARQDDDTTPSFQARNSINEFYKTR